MPTPPLAFRHLRHALNTAAAYRVLDRTKACGGTWCQGACALLAFALGSLIPGSTVVALCAPQAKPQHLAVRLPDGRYADGDGISTRRTLLRHWHGIEREHGPITLRPVGPRDLDATAIPHDLRDIARVRTFLASTLSPLQSPEHQPARRFLEGSRAPTR